MLSLLKLLRLAGGEISYPHCLAYQLTVLMAGIRLAQNIAGKITVAKIALGR
jgi:hypothetical protein